MNLCQVTKFSLYSKNNGPVWQKFSMFVLGILIDAM